MDINKKPIRWDVFSGIVVVVIAAAFLIVGSRLNFGSLRQMGPGFVPVAASALLAGLGLVVIFEGLTGEPTAPSLPKLRPFLVVAACPLVFGALIGWAGMVPTVVATSLLARMAEPLKWGWDLILVPLILSVLSVVVFIEFVGVAIPAF